MQCDEVHAPRDEAFQPFETSSRPGKRLHPARRARQHPEAEITTSKQSSVAAHPSRRIPPVSFVDPPPAIHEPSASPPTRECRHCASRILDHPRRDAKAGLNLHPRSGRANRHEHACPRRPRGRLTGEPSYPRVAGLRAATPRCSSRRQRRSEEIRRSSSWVLPKEAPGARSRSAANLVLGVALFGVRQERGPRRDAQGGWGVAVALVTAAEGWKRSLAPLRGGWARTRGSPESRALAEPWGCVSRRRLREPARRCGRPSSARGCLARRSARWPGPHRRRRSRH